MLTQVESSKRQWQGLHKSIDAWLQERQQLLVQYCELAGLPPFERPENSLPDSQAITNFCETLVDYVSAGHFEVYDKLTNESENPSMPKRIEDEVYAEISESTELALSFNDCFAAIEDQNKLSLFDSQLSELGQKLEKRFELEDQLISSYAQQL